MFMSLALFCFSDLHNDLGAVRRLAGEALVANFDFLVSAGDLAVASSEGTELRPGRHGRVGVTCNVRGSG
jgi:Icc-related predicted phosphoesterase